MPKFDGDRYPAKLTAEEAAEIAEVVANEFDGEALSEEAFAQAIGHSTSNSGSFIKKVADARSYGILPTRGLEITQLGQRIANPRDEAERKETLFEMYQNIPILANLYEHLDGREPPNNLWSILIEISEAERNEAKEAEDDIRELYEAMLQFDESDSKSGETQQPSQQSQVTPDTVDERVEITPETPDSAIFLKVGNDEHKFGELSQINIEIAQKILKSKLKELEQTDVQEKEEQTPETDSANLHDF